MKKGTILIVLALAVVVAAVLLLRRERPWGKAEEPGLESVELGAPEGEAVVIEEPPAPLPFAPPPEEIRAILQQKPVEVVAPHKAEQEPKFVELPPDAILATVNGAPITPRDLIPLRPQDAGRPIQMDAIEFDARLDEAIATEVILQAAAAQGVQLTEDQAAVVRSLRARAQADIAAARAEGLMWTSVSEEQLDFTERHATALLLQQNLMIAQGLPASPVLTEEQILQYYEANKETYGELPTDPAAREAAWGGIRDEISALLWPYLQKKYEEMNREYLEKLKQGADIQITTPAT